MPIFEEFNVVVVNDGEFNEPAKFVFPPVVIICKLFTSVFKVANSVFNVVSSVFNVTTFASKLVTWVCIVGIVPKAVAKSLADETDAALDI